MVESIPTILEWLARFKRNEPDQQSRISVGWRDGRDVLEGFCVSTVADIEESVWAPKYGLKGKIDVSVEATFVASAAPQVQSLGCLKNYLAISNELCNEVNNYR